MLLQSNPKRGHWSKKIEACEQVSIPLVMLAKHPGARAFLRLCVSITEPLRSCPSSQHDMIAHFRRHARPRSLVRAKQLGARLRGRLSNRPNHTRKPEGVTGPSLIFGFPHEAHISKTVHVSAIFFQHALECLDHFRLYPFAWTGGKGVKPWG